MVGQLIRKLASYILLVLMLFSLLSFILPVPVLAQGGGIAMSGNFYQHHFQVVLGESVSTPRLYVVVFNHENNEVNIILTPDTPSGVELILEETEFSIPSGGQHSVNVGLTMGPQAVLGNYILTITAEVKHTGEGIAVIGGAQQQARLTILGEAGTVSAKTVTCLGDSFPAVINVYRLQEEYASPCAYSPTGELTARLVPADYNIRAFYNDIEVAREDFTLKANETKDITVVAQTAFIKGFSIVPNYYEDTGDMAFANVVYTIENIYQPIKSLRANLDVAFEGAPLGQDEIISLPTLDTGSMSGSYKYTRTQKWQDGAYTFKITLYAQDKLCAQSPEETLEVRRVPVPSIGGINWMLWGPVAGGILLLIVIVVLVVIKRSRAQ